MTTSPVSSVSRSAFLRPRLTLAMNRRPLRTAQTVLVAMTGGVAVADGVPWRGRRSRPAAVGSAARPATLRVSASHRSSLASRGAASRPAVQLDQHTTPRATVLIATTSGPTCCPVAARATTAIPNRHRRAAGSQSVATPLPRVSATRARYGLVPSSERQGCWRVPCQQRACQAVVCPIRADPY